MAKVMEAFLLKDSIARLLEGHSGGRYAVVTPRRRESDAEDIFAMPEVTVLYAEGNFDRSKSSGNSPYHHDASFNIHILAGAKATVDLKALQNPDATPEQYAAALAASENASMLLDEKLDGLLSVLFDILMNPEHRDLGAGYNTNRWITGMKKSNPEKIGAVVVGSASIIMTAQCPEEVTGEIGAPAGEGAVDTVLNPEAGSKQGARA